MTRGAQSLKFASTQMNRHSSRSHAICRLFVEGKVRRGQSSHVRTGGGGGGGGGSGCGTPHDPDQGTRMPRPQLVHVPLATGTRTIGTPRRGRMTTPRAPAQSTQCVTVDLFADDGGDDSRSRPPASGAPYPAPPPVMTAPSLDAELDWNESRNASQRASFVGRRTSQSSPCIASGFADGSPYSTRPSLYRELSAPSPSLLVSTPRTLAALSSPRFGSEAAASPRRSVDLDVWRRQSVAMISEMIRNAVSGSMGARNSHNHAHGRYDLARSCPSSMIVLYTVRIQYFTWYLVYQVMVLTPLDASTAASRAHTPPLCTPPGSPWVQHRKRVSPPRGRHHCARPRSTVCFVVFNTPHDHTSQQASKQAIKARQQSTCEQASSPPSANGRTDGDTREC